MKVTLQYFDGCPNWKETDAHLKNLRAEGFDLDVDHQLIDTPELAEVHRFRGSPTVLIDGVDPFAEPAAPIGLSCRVYETSSGFAGSPSLDSLRSVLQEAS